MIYAFDTYYLNDIAKSVCIAFEEWDSDIEKEIFTEKTSVAAQYESGAFYKRELPCILSLLSKINLKENDIIIVDGYVSLNDDGKMGLGGYLYEALDKNFPIVGIAKNEFSAADSQRRSVYRGVSKTALFVTAIGIDVDEVQEKIEKMHGSFRFPTLLKKLDQLTRE